MSWLSLSKVVAAMRAHTSKVGSCDDTRIAGAALAMHTHPPQLVTELPELVNCGALAWLMRDRLVVHEVRSPVPRVVAATDLHSLPDEPPRLLRSPWIAEVRTPGPEMLFGSTAALGCYELDGTHYIVGLQYPDGCTVARWRPQWRGGDLAAGAVVEVDASLIEGMDRDEHWHWAQDAARFAVVLGLLLDAAGTPLRTADDPPRSAGRHRGEWRPARPWAVRRVYLGDQPGSASGGGGGGHQREDVVAAQVEVRGHLKRQPHGPGGTQRRWIYVASYEARRWVAPQSKVVVGARG